MTQSVFMNRLRKRVAASDQAIDRRFQQIMQQQPRASPGAATSTGPSWIDTSTAKSSGVRDRIGKFYLEKDLKSN